VWGGGGGGRADRRGGGGGLVVGCGGNRSIRVLRVQPVGTRISKKGEGEQQRRGGHGGLEGGEGIGLDIATHLPSRQKFWGTAGTLGAGVSRCSGWYGTRRGGEREQSPPRAQPINGIKNTSHPSVPYFLGKIRRKRTPKSRRLIHRACQRDVSQTLSPKGPQKEGKGAVRKFGRKTAGARCAGSMSGKTPPSLGVSSLQSEKGLYQTQTLAGFRGQKRYLLAG